MKTLISTFCASFLLASVTTARAEIVDLFRSFDWEGGTVLHDDTSEYLGCFLTARYNSGIRLYFLLTKDRSFSINLTHPNWRFIKDETIALTMAVNGAGQISVNGRASDENSLTFLIEASENNYNILRRGSLMTIRFRGRRYEFRLTRTMQSIPRLMACAYESEQRYAFRGAPSPSVRPRKEEASRPNEAPAPSQNRFQERLEVMEIITNLSTKARLTDFQIISDSAKRQEFGNPDVLWTATALTGLTSIIAVNDPDLISAETTQSYSRACKGKFSSAMRRDVISGKNVIITAMECIEERDDVLVNHVLINQLIIPRRAGGHYLFITSEKPAEGSSGRNEQGVQARNAALDLMMGRQ